MRPLLSRRRNRPTRSARFRPAHVLVMTALAVAALGLARPALAQEMQILEAIRKGEIQGGSLLAVPAKPAEVGRSPALSAAPLPPPARPADDFVFGIAKAQERDIVNRAFPLLASKWPFDVVYVCWERPLLEDREHRTLVRQAVAETWEAHSGIALRGWNTCTPTSTGIRIAVEDTGPHVKFLGKFVDGVPDGMVLNFTFGLWSPSCQATRDSCIRSIAVHEFGHAIGFAHEQNRPDTPGECFEMPQGTDGDTTKLTPWDPVSVMNYCNPVYNNDGVLSPFDIVAAQYIYGTP